MLNLHLYGINHQKFKQLEMPSYQSGFCFEEPFSQRKAWTSPEILFDPQLFFSHQKKKRLKDKEKILNKCFLRTTNTKTEESR